MRTPLTLLYAPADRPDVIAKAFASAADAVLVDLEDAVAAGAKDSARSGLPDVLTALLREYPGRNVQVRVNSIGTQWCEQDLAVVSTLEPSVALRAPINNRRSRLPQAGQVLSCRVC